MKKIIEHLINQIVDLKIKQIELENKYRKVTNEKVAADNIIYNLKKEITNLRTMLSSQVDEQRSMEIFITDADKQ
jgi:lipopolysaccharide export system protein LptA